MKTIDRKIITHEIDFCNFYSKYPNRCFVRCYGYILKNDSVNAIIYQYMSNGTLHEYMEKNENEINNIFSFITACRILYGLNYLQKHRLVHRDLNPSNVLVDHDGKAYISDFETICFYDEKCNEIENLAKSDFSTDICSFYYFSPEQMSRSAFNLSTDIYMFGEIIYFLFEKVDIFSNLKKQNEILVKKKNDDIPEMKTQFQLIKNIYETCIRCKYDQRSSIKDIQTNIYQQFDSYCFLNYYFVNDISSLKLMTQYFYEICNIIMLLDDMNDQLNNFIDNHLFSFFFLNNNSIEQNQSDSLFILGSMFYQGKYVSKNFSKALKCFELSANENNLNSLLALGDITFHVEQDKNKSEFYYHQYSNIYNYKDQKDAHLYFDYFFESLNNIEFEYYILKQNLIFTDQLHNSYTFSFLEYIYTNVYGKKTNYFDDFIKNQKSKTNCLLNKLAKSSTFLYIGHILNFGKENDPNYFGLKEFHPEFDNFIFDDDDTELKQYPENLTTKGFLYENGIIYEKNNEKAEYYYKLAEKQNNENASLNLGNIYFYNEFLRSKHYYEKVLANSYANLYLANLLYRNNNPKDYEESKKYAKRSSEMNNPNALNLLGFMYYIDKDYSKAHQYYELAMKLNYVYSANNLGYLYRKGIGVQQNYQKSIEYYEFAAKEYILNALYQLASFYSNGEGIDVDLNKAINLFSTCIRVYDEKYLMTYLRQIYVLCSTSIQYDKTVYLAYNDLAVIHTIESDYFNMKISEKYFKDAAFSEYAFGQNNYCIFLQFFLNQKDEAKKRFAKPVENNFALSEYNLGYFYEIEEPNIEESIHYYTMASDHENNDVVLLGERIFDNRLEISKTFIICLANFKLVLHHLLENNYNQAKNYFERIFAQLDKKYNELKHVLNIDNQTEYKFHFKFFKDNGKNIFSYLKFYVLNYPLFNLKNQKNLSLEDIDHFDENCFINAYDFLEKLADSFRKSQVKLKFKDELNDKTDFFSFDDSNHDDLIFKTILNQYLEDPAYLFQYIYYSDFKNLFIEEIKEIVNIMQKILYTPPYTILFGRIWTCKK